MTSINVSALNNGDESASGRVVSDGNNRYALVIFSPDFGGMEVIPLEQEEASRFTPEQLEAIKKVLDTGVRESFPDLYSPHR